jgi:hypothetical protein
MKFYLFTVMAIFGFALGQGSDLQLDNFEENNSYFSIAGSMKNQNVNWIGQQEYVQEVEDSCDMRGRACMTYFYWKGYAFWLLEGNINAGSFITLSKVINVSDRDSLRFIFIDEDSNLIRASFVHYHDDIIFTESTVY